MDEYPTAACDEPRTETRTVNTTASFWPLPLITSLFIYCLHIYHLIYLISIHFLGQIGQRKTGWLYISQSFDLIYVYYTYYLFIIRSICYVQSTTWHYTVINISDSASTSPWVMAVVQGSLPGKLTRSVCRYYAVQGLGALITLFVLSASRCEEEDRCRCRGLCLALPSLYGREWCAVLFSHSFIFYFFLVCVWGGG